MKILLTGANGYIGKRLLPVLVEDGHDVVCLVRNPDRLSISETLRQKTTVIPGDLLDPDSLSAIPNDIDAAFYLVHSMGNTAKDFATLEERCAENFANAVKQTSLKQIIYLSGIVNDENLSMNKYITNPILN